MILSGFEQPKLASRDFERLFYWPDEPMSGSEARQCLIEARDKFLADDCEQTRLDFRPKIAKDDIPAFKEAVKELDENIEIAEVPLNGSDYHELHVCLNKGPRLLEQAEVDDLRTTVSGRIERAMSKTALKKAGDLTGRMRKWEDFSFHRHTEERAFSADELYRLWKNAHNLDRDAVQHILDDRENHHIFGMRDREGRLVAAMIFERDGEKWESTEWTTCESLRQHGLMEGLLLVANAWAVRHKLNAYAHLRHGRSDRLGVQTGMKIDHVNGGPLTHHAVIEVGGRTNEGMHNGRYRDTRHVWVGTLDHSRFSKADLELLISKLT